MRFLRGERWRCQNHTCTAEIQILVSSAIEGENPRCSCGGFMKKPYTKPESRLEVRDLRSQLEFRNNEISRREEVLWPQITKTVSMERLKFSPPFVILLTLVFVLLGGSLLHNSISSPGITQPWELLGGAVLFSLALTFACFLAKHFSH